MITRSSIFTIIMVMLIWSMTAMGQQWYMADIDIIIDGNTLSSGLAGGLNSPQFRKMDVNRDGVDDIYVFDRDGYRSLVFEAIVNGDCYAYTFNERLSSFFPYMEEFAIPYDFSGDGVPDLITYSLDGSAGMQILLGIDAGDHLEFELVIMDHSFGKNVLSIDFGSTQSNLPVSRIDLPAIVDIDQDGDFDIVSFPSSGGQVILYQNEQVERSLNYDQMVFTVEDDCWGGFYENDFSEEISLAESINDCADNFGAGETRHNGSTTLIYDPNHDGLYDALIGDFTSNNLVHLQNGGNPNNAWMTSQDFKFPVYDVSANMPTFLGAYYLDVDCDDKNDLLVAPNIRNASYKTDNAWFYKNIGDTRDSFEFQRNDFLSNEMFDIGKKAAPALVDLNADGWLDLVVGQQIEDENPNAIETALVSFLHNGDENNPAYLLDDFDYLGLSPFAAASYTFAPTFADMDADGDMDIIVGDEEGFLFYGENVAGPGAPVDIPNLIYGWKGIDAGQFATPTVADLNGDGLLDLIIGEKNPNNDINTNLICGNINYYQNIGTPTEPDFIDDSRTPPNLNCLGNILTRYRNDLNAYGAPTFYDTGDSLLMFVGTNGGTIARHKVMDVGEEFPLIDSIYAGLDEGFLSMPAIGDIDQDGYLEFVIGNQRGGIIIYDSPILTDGSISSSVDVESQEDISIYPNPVSNGESLYWTSDSKVERCRLFDMQGRLILDVKMNSENNSLALPNILDGMYLIQFTVGKEIQTKKILVIHE